MKLISLILLVIILTEALSESLFDLKHKTFSKAIQVIMFVAYFAFAFYSAKFGWYWSYIALWLFWRGLLFNTTYNLVCGLPYNFFGRTSIIDRVFMFITQANLWMWIIFQAICAVFIWAITFNQL